MGGVYHFPQENMDPRLVKALRNGDPPEVIRELRQQIRAERLAALASAEIVQPETPALAPDSEAAAKDQSAPVEAPQQAATDIDQSDHGLA